LPTGVRDVQICVKGFCLTPRRRRSDRVAIAAIRPLLPVIELHAARHAGMADIDHIVVRGAAGSPGVACRGYDIQIAYHNPARLGQIIAAKFIPHSGPIYRPRRAHQGTIHSLCDC